MKRTLRLRNNRIFAFERMEMMGIINVTPDSFYRESRMMGEVPGPDGGPEAAREAAFAKAARFVEEGARFIDIGGESTRPGAMPVTTEEEIRRVCPVVGRVKETWPEIIVSVDTYRADTARAALEAGADMINDISGLTFEPDLAKICADAGAAIVLMHTGGRPETMQQDPSYGDVVREVHDYLSRQIGFAVECGIGRDQIMIDVGIGFGKSREHNLALLQNLDQFDDLGCPHLLAVSRKSFIGSTLGREDPADRLPGTLAVTAWGAERGMAAARVHDVKENLDAARMIEELLGR